MANDEKENSTDDVDAEAPAADVSDDEAIEIEDELTGGSGYPG